jgi:excinuclease ABC subunit B
MREALDETERRRKIQHEFNVANNIEPRSIVTIIPIKKENEVDSNIKLAELEKLMSEAAENLMFEDAAKYRDKMNKIKAQQAATDPSM